MLYVDFKAGDKDYKLRLATRDIIALEKSIGMNPISIFGDGRTIPSLTVMIAVLHASLQKFQHGINLTDAYEIFDEYLADGHTMTDFISVIVEIYKVSGLIANDNESAEETNEKN